MVFAVVARCPPLMDIVLHMLNGYLLASKAYLHCHLKETADFDRSQMGQSSGWLANRNSITPSLMTHTHVHQASLLNSLFS